MINIYLTNILIYCCWLIASLRLHLEIDLNLRCKTKIQEWTFGPEKDERTKLGKKRKKKSNVKGGKTTSTFWTALYSLYWTSRVLYILYVLYDLYDLQD